MPSEGIELETFCVNSVSLTKWPSLIDLYMRQINKRQQKTGHIIILREARPVLRFLPPLHPYREQKAINGKGARPNISLAAVKQNNGVRFQLLQKYADMFLVDKNPTDNAGAAPLADATK